MRWFWHADLPLRLAQAILESLWVYGCALMLSAVHAPEVRLGFGWIASVQLTAVCVALASERLPFRAGVTRALLLLFAAAAVMAWVQLVGSSSPMSWGLAMYLTARGSLLGLQPAGAYTARWFTIGAVTLVLLSAVLARVAAELTPTLLDRLRAVILGYFAGGSALLALVHRASVLRQAQVPPTFSAPWLIAIALPIVLVGCASIALASATSTVRTVLELCYQVTELVGQRTLQILGRLVWSLGELLRWIGSLFGVAADSGRQPRGPGHGGPPVQPTCQPDARHLPGVTTGDPTPYFLLIALAIGVWAFVRVLVRTRTWRPAATERENEDSDSLWSWRLFIRQLREFWQAMIASWRVGMVRLIERIAAPGDRGLEPETAHDIRGVYRALLRWAARRGERRATGTTPLEFADQLENRLGANEQVRWITAHYVQERYGETDTRPEDVAQAVRALEDLARSSAKR